MNSITADQINMIDGAKKQLFSCTTKETAEKVFSACNISDTGAKIALLHRCMQVRNVYSCPGGTPLTEEELYDETLGFFVEGQWRELI